jgi:iron complex transport system substrate-binding protein
MEKASMEGVLGLEPDFYYSGWLYGFNNATGVTPKELAKYGIGTYVLNESCIRVGPRPPLSMQSTYGDIDALGRIFGVEAKAQAIIAQQKQKIAAVQTRLTRVKRRYRVMYCSGCIDDSAPRTTGAQGFPKVIIDQAGGKHIFDDIEDSYVNVSWEAVLQRDPEWLIIDANWRRPEEVISYLTTSRQLKDVTAIKKRQFIFVRLPEFEPSTRNAEAIERIARTLYPEAFKP